MRHVTAVFILVLIFAIGLANSTEHHGESDFSASDRLAVKNLISAYAYHWDSGNVDEFLKLFTEDAISITYEAGKHVIGKINDESAIEQARKRTGYFKTNKMQRRHMMNSTLFISQTEDRAEVIQYCILMTTNRELSKSESSAKGAAVESTESKIVSPIVYNFQFRKVDSHWKIESREIKLDAILDVP